MLIKELEIEKTCNKRKDIFREIYREVRIIKREREERERERERERENV